MDKARILIVEDEAITAMDLKDRLQEQGYIVLDTAVSGEEAILLTEKNKPDLILMDIILKGEIDGIQAALHISKLHKIPIIFLTAYNDESTFNRAKLSDPYGYLSKPFETRDLQIAIELALFKHEMQVGRLRAESRLIYLSQHDMLTDLYNRSTFQEFLILEIARLHKEKTSFALLLLDLDNFKLVNDSFGYHIGDQLLKLVAKLLQENVRENDIVARVGGDEFIILFRDIKDILDVNLLAKNLVARFSKPFKIEDNIFNSTFSIGVVVAPTDGKDSETLLQNADIALYSAKDQSGNNFQFFSSSINNIFKHRALLESALPSATELNQLFLVYQPQHSLPNKHISGIEVLLRWQHPEYGLIMPDEFIPIAEKNGFIATIDEWVLKNACRQYTEWLGKNLISENIRLSVNLSPSHISKDQFIGFLIQVLNNSGMPAKSLELELTESAVMTNSINLDPVLRQLQDKGIKISIDDFGIGYSSLNRLKTLPISTLKIDKSFISNLDHDADAMIVKSIIALGNSLGLNVITEGVETQAQLDFLTQNNCGIVQGFYFEKPLSAEDMTHLLIKYRR